MNAYWFDAGEIRYDYDAETSYYESSQACGIYFGETRGKAKVLFIKEWNMLDFTTPMRIRLLAKNMDSCGNTDADLLNKFSLWTLVDDLIKKEGYYK